MAIFSPPEEQKMAIQKNKLRRVSVYEYMRLRNMDGEWLSVVIKDRAARKTMAEWDAMVRLLRQEPA
jgi:hypothetical protein